MQFGIILHPYNLWIKTNKLKFPVFQRFCCQYSLINCIKAETNQTKLNSSICALFETIPQREFIETGYDPTASNRSRICSTTSNDNNIIQSDAKIDAEKTTDKGM